MMRVPQRLDYALRALTLLADRGAEAPIAAGQLAAKLGLPNRFVEQQVTALARAGIVESRRGAGGGCRLARPADEVTVLDVVTALEGDVLDVPHTTGSAVAEMWQAAESVLAKHLATVTLADLAARQREIDSAAVVSYVI